MTLVENGSYACAHCHAVHEVIEVLRSRFGEKMRYVFRHLPVSGSEDATRASELAEYAAQTAGRFLTALRLETDQVEADHCVTTRSIPAAAQFRQPV